MLLYDLTRLHHARIHPSINLARNLEAPEIGEYRKQYRRAVKPFSPGPSMAASRSLGLLQFLGDMQILTTQCVPVATTRTACRVILTANLIQAAP